MLNGVICSKLQALERHLGELKSLGEVSATTLAGDWRIRGAVERNLQVLTEIVIDVCQRILALAGQSPATTGADAVRRCAELGALGTAEAYRRMVQFRNFIVHRYEQVNVDILADILKNHLGEFDRFRQEIQAYVSH